MSRRRILIASPIRLNKDMLALFLQSLLRLRQGTWTCDFLFIDDNDDAASSVLLRQFSDAVNEEQVSRVTFLPGRLSKPTYYRDETTHYWNDELIDQIADWKDDFIAAARDGHYEALFLLDSDLLLHPDTIESLLASEQPLISCIFWTKWTPGSPELPQVWLKDHYWPWQHPPGDSAAESEQVRLLEQYRTPGVYSVGGLGACTLIRMEALAMPISFRRIPNLSLWGEDRHFCVRAASLGIPLAVDTHYPAFHMYRESELVNAQHYMRKTEPSSNAVIRVPDILVKRAGPRLVLSMSAANEEGRYLSDALLRHREYIDAAVVIDDGSTDATADIIHDRLQGIPLYYVRNERTKFTNEIELRLQQWNKTVQLNPQWILNLDADEYFEDRFTDQVRGLIDHSDAHLYCFRLYDFWNETQYREDSFWQAHRTYRPFLLRYIAGYPYQWNEMRQHCGRFPRNLFDMPSTQSPLRLKHWGWARESDRQLKAARYARLDPDARYGWKEQYESILDSRPRLIDWRETEMIDAFTLPTGTIEITR
ncbi:glycosyltransferase family A protein [Paenibacillus kobensis]|uniref:glycosyltransferase family A protein n=1 Tax=Paenibacillus kobensis TaxID=59841 RepID=UPI000FDCD656|nr:glycosyltransferase family A protein [Paenibacillus kobensis]